MDRQHRNITCICRGDELIVHGVGCFKALGAAEDETDIQAAKVARAELKDELAEFDESIPWDEREVNAKREREEQSKVEMELTLLEKEVCFLLMCFVIPSYSLMGQYFKALNNIVLRNGPALCNSFPA